MNVARRKFTTNLVSAAIIVAGFAAAFGLSNFLEAARPAPPAGAEDEDLAFQGARLKNFSLGFNGLLADWYWMRSLQYVGGKILKSEAKINLDDLKPLNPRLLYPLLDTATTLDPRFTTAYSYGAIVLPAIDARQAIRFTEKGIADNPGEWRLYQHLGYIHWRLGDYERAAAAYADGARIEGAPPFMGLMAAQMKTQGGSRATARRMYEQMFAEARDDNTRETAALRLLQIDSLDERDVIGAALREFQARNNRCARDWREAFPLLRNRLTADGKVLRFDSQTLAPVDPSGVAYQIASDANRCEANLDRKISKIPAQ